MILADELFPLPQSPAAALSPAAAGPSPSGLVRGLENHDEKPRPDGEIVIVVYGIPGPQGSKRHLGNGVMVESSKKVKPWRQDVKTAALTAMECGQVGSVTIHRPPLDGPLAASVVFTVRDQPASKPSWWPTGARWSKTLRWRPASTPDLSKLLRATEDALTGVVWRDDARVVEYDRLAKFYCDYPAADVLDRPGAVIRVWPIGGAE